MPEIAYIQVKGEEQGLITSGANSEDSMGKGNFKDEWSDYSKVIAFEHKITLPVDPMNGQPAGSRLHKPFVIHKEFDKASPLLYKALCSGESLEVEMIWRRTKGSEQTKYFTHKLFEAILVNVDAIMPIVTMKENESRKHEERWSFSYRKIEWEHTEASTSSSDDWQEG